MSVGRGASPPPAAAAAPPLPPPAQPFPNLPTPPARHPPPSLPLSLDMLDADWLELDGGGGGEGEGEGDPMDQEAASVSSGAVHSEDGSMVRMRSVGGPSRAGFDRPPRLRVHFRLRQATAPGRDPTAAYRHAQHAHPVALASADFSKRFPAAKQPGVGWTCDGKVGPAGTRPCRHHSSGNTGRYRCTMGEDYDLCESCFELGVKMEEDEKIKAKVSVDPKSPSNGMGADLRAQGRWCF